MERYPLRKAMNICKKKRNDWKASLTGTFPFKQMFNFKSDGIVFIKTARKIATFSS